MTYMTYTSAHLCRCIACFVAIAMPLAPICFYMMHPGPNLEDSIEHQETNNSSAVEDAPRWMGSLSRGRFRHGKYEGFEYQV